MTSIRRRLITAAGIVSLVVACGRGDTRAGADVMPRKDEPTPAAPSVFTVKFETSKGPFTLEVHRDWSPQGVDRFYQLVNSGYYDNTRFFRVVQGFVAQFGKHGDPAVGQAWDALPIPDDPPAESNVRGTVTFATGGPNTRTTQLFINLGDNQSLDRQGFTPIGRVVEGMDVVDKFFAGYGDGPPFGQGPDQGRIASEGNAYLEREFPDLDFVRAARVVSGGSAETSGSDTTK